MERQHIADVEAEEDDAWHIEEEERWGEDDADADGELLNQQGSEQA